MRQQENGVRDLDRNALAAVVGAAIGAVALGMASLATGGTIGLNAALRHVPSGTHGYEVASAGATAFAGSAAGGGIEATSAAAAKSSPAH